LIKQGKSKDAIALLRKARDLYEKQGKQDNANRVEATIRKLRG
jgi:hypothetical protein